MIEILFISFYDKNINLNGKLKLYLIKFNFKKQEIFKTFLKMYFKNFNMNNNKIYT